ncbi:hypothetical protein Tco_0231051, partial [Tanacetum coccineum]
WDMSGIYNWLQVIAGAESVGGCGICKKVMSISLDDCVGLIWMLGTSRICWGKFGVLLGIRPLWNSSGKRPNLDRTWWRLAIGLLDPHKRFFKNSWVVGGVAACFTDMLSDWTNVSWEEELLSYLSITEFAFLGSRPPIIDSMEVNSEGGISSGKGKDASGPRFGLKVFGNVEESWIVDREKRNEDIVILVESFEEGEGREGGGFRDDSVLGLIVVMLPTDGLNEDGSSGVGEVWGRGSGREGGGLVRGWVGCEERGGGVAELSSASALQVLKRLGSIFTSVYAAVQKQKKAFGKSFSSAWLTIPS